MSRTKKNLMYYPQQRHMRYTGMFEHNMWLDGGLHNYMTGAVDTVL